MLRIPHWLDNRLTEGGKVANPKPQGLVRPEGLGKFKKSPHRESKPRPSGLYFCALTSTLPRSPPPPPSNDSINVPFPSRSLESVPGSGQSHSLLKCFSLCGISRTLQAALSACQRVGQIACDVSEWRVPLCTLEDLKVLFFPWRRIRL
jgi:hypothetical protein